MDFQNALGFAAHSWPTTKVHDAWINSSVQPRLSEINAVWRELLVVGAQVCGWESNFSSEIVAAHNRPQNRVFAAKHLRCLCEITCFKGLTNRRTAHQLAVDGHRRNSHNTEIEACAELVEQFEIAAPVFSKRPFVPHANFAQRFRMLHQLLHEVFGLGCGKLLIKLNDQKMRHAEVADQSDLVRRSGEQMRRAFWP